MPVWNRISTAMNQPMPRYPITKPAVHIPSPINSPPEFRMFEWPM